MNSEAQAQRMVNGAYRGSQVCGRRLVASRRRDGVSVARGIILAHSTSRDNWLGRGQRVLVATFIRTTRQARRSEGFQNVLAQALGGAQPAHGPWSV